MLIKVEWVTASSLECIMSLVKSYFPVFLFNFSIRSAKYDGRLPDCNISASEILVLCKACDKYLELLNGNESNSLTSDERIMSEKDLSIKAVMAYHDQNGYDVNATW